MHWIATKWIPSLLSEKKKNCVRTCQDHQEKFGGGKKTRIPFKDNHR